MAANYRVSDEDLLINRLSTGAGLGIRVLRDKDFLEKGQSCQKNGLTASRSL